MIGYGKMGKTIEGLALKNGHEIVLKITANNLEDLNAQNLKKADVAIEFSRPDTAYSNIMQCFEVGLPVVCGTTAWLDQYDSVVQHCLDHQNAFFYASNFSIGVNIFFEINKRLARLMNRQPNYKVSVEEIHHIHKLDAPSGTAVTIAEDIIESLDDYQNYSLRTAETAATTLAITAKRIADTPGTHVVHYDSTLDSLEIKHAAKGRTGFAQGALMAAEWIIDKKGVFGMSDLLNLNQ